VEYPAIVEAHTASSLRSGADAAAWRTRLSTPAASVPHTGVPSGETIENVILKRGSSRRFSREPISSDALALMLGAAIAPIPTDAWIETDAYLIVNSVEGLSSGAYVYDRSSHKLERLKTGEFSREAVHLDLGQELAGDAAVNVYWLVNLDSLDDRAYRAAQLVAAIEGGRLYLAAYALGLGATGLTFFDDDVTSFFSPHAAGKSVMFLVAVGHPRRRDSI
jgi:nitroreductase